MLRCDEKENRLTKKWVLRASQNEAELSAVSEIARELSISTVTAQLLYNRGFRTPKDAIEFLEMRTETLGDPFLMKDMELAVARIDRAIRNGEHITVYGDYDVDGVTSVCTLYLYLKSKGATVDYFIPNREGDGYGISRAAIDMLKESGSTLVITVDTGITAIEEIEYAKTQGVDFVVTDHHECRPTLPSADAVVNPHRPDCPYPFKELAGVGVVFKLICAYECRDTGKSLAICLRPLYDAYADLVSIGTIADVMPLIGENRLVVGYGLSRIEHTTRVGLRALMDASSHRTDAKDGKTGAPRQAVTSSYIGFTLAPRINAAGRIRSAALAVELFLTENETEAMHYAQCLCDANRERQDEENKIMIEVYERISDAHDFEKEPILVLDADTWHHGVIGIVSSRVTERYAAPCILISFKGNGDAAPSGEDVGKGSGRSVKGLNLVETLAYASEYLLKYGGHELAAGLSLKRSDLPLFKEKINEYARLSLAKEAPIPVIEAECELSFSQIRMNLLQEMRKLEPYGTGNPIPLFVLHDARVLEITPLKNGKHTKLLVGHENSRLTAMCFSRSPSDLDVHIGDTVSLLFQLDINEWGGRSSVQMIVRDLRVTRHFGDAPELLAARARFKEIWNGAPFTADEDVLPVREDFAVVYVYIQHAVRTGTKMMSHGELMTGVAHKRKIGYIKLMYIIRVMQEMNLLHIEDVSNELYRFSLRFPQARVDLEKSHLLYRLRMQMRAQ